MTQPDQNDAVDPATAAQAAVELTIMASGFMQSQALYAVAKLRIADELLPGPLAVPELAARVGADADSLRRLLRTLSAFGLFRLVGSDIYAVEPKGTALATGTPGSLADLIISWMESHYETFGRFADRIRTGRPGFYELHGEHFFTWLNDHPDQLGHFARGMRNFTEGVLTPLLESYRLPAGRVVADIGGNDGSLLVALLAGDPDRRGIVFDGQDLRAQAEKRIAADGLGDRVTFVDGDFFAAVPAADVYVLKQILHDWNDENAARILRTVAAAAHPGAKVVLIEGVVPPTEEFSAVKLADLVLLGLLEGKERTAEEFRELLGRAGFELNRIVSTSSFFSIIEATLA